MTLSDTAITLHTQFSSSSTSWSRAYTLEAAPAARATIASLLAHAVGEAETRFVHAVIEEPDHATTPVQVSVFTDDTITVVTGTLSPSATVLPRTALRALKITSAPNVVNGNSRDPSTPLRAELDYGTLLDGPLTLGHRDQSLRNAVELAAFLPELRRDLSR
jgi:hypothetical protein